MTKTEMHQLLLLAARLDTLGDIAEVFREMKRQGITRGSMLYVVDQVWWEDEATVAPWTEDGIGFSDSPTFLEFDD